MGILPPKGSFLTLPCPGDPVRNPEIVSSGGSGKKGGTFGCTRKDIKRVCDGVRGNKKHDGIDIKVSVFEPIYAIKSGLVISIRKSFGALEYKKDSYGNYVEILSTDENGNVIKIKYNHLGDTQLILGDFIQQGSIIGLAGKSGNAAIASVTPHVHIQAKIKQPDGSFKKSDPFQFFASNNLNAEFDIQTSTNCN